MFRNKILVLTAVALTAVVLTLVTPAKSEAQGFSFSMGSPRVGVGISTGYYPTWGGYSGFYPSNRYYGNFGYGGYYGSGFGYGYGGRAFVNPQFNHWTPYRGWHTHGTVTVPSWGGYYTVPY